MRLLSKRLNREFEAECYKNGESMIIRHTSLRDIYWNCLADEEKPLYEVDVMDLTRLPGVPPMFAIKCTMDKNGVHIEEIGEMLCLTWNNSNEITKNNPLAICQNRAFDKAFIRYMQFSVPVAGIMGIYSSEEIPIDSKSIPLTGTVNKDLPPVANNQPNSDATRDNTENNFTHNVPNNISNIPDQIPNNSIRVNRFIVQRVTYDPVFRKTQIQTDKGIFYFTPSSGIWESLSIDIQLVDLRALYYVASDYVKTDLRNFCGK